MRLSGTGQVQGLTALSTLWLMTLRDRAARDTASVCYWRSWVTCGNRSSIAHTAWSHCMMWLLLSSDGQITYSNIGEFYKKVLIYNLVDWLFLVIEMKDVYNTWRKGFINIPIYLKRSQVYRLYSAIISHGCIVLQPGQPSKTFFNMRQGNS